MTDSSREGRTAAARFQALCELAQEMALVEDEASMHGVVLDVSRRVLEFVNCAILLIDEDSGELVIVAQHGYPEETQGLRLSLEGERGISRWVAEHGRTLYVPDVREDPRYVPGVPEARSELAVPIRIRDRTIGVINVESDRVDAFDPEGAFLLEALASQLAVMLELRRARTELQRLTWIDALTAAYNRRYLDQALAAEIERAERYAHPLGLVMFDLDDFKEINDRFGHEVGDRVLIAFADLLRQAVRGIDTVIRYGGDEFLVMMPETAGEGVALAAQRIRDAVEAALNASEEVPGGWPLRISVGYAVRLPGDEAGERLREADRAMYADKHAREFPRAEPLGRDAVNG